MIRVALILALLWQSAFAAATPSFRACAPAGGCEACLCCPLCEPDPRGGCACCAGEPAREPVAPAATGPSRAPLEPALPVEHPGALVQGHGPDRERCRARMSAADRPVTCPRRLALLCVRVV